MEQLKKIMTCVLNIRNGKIADDLSRDNNENWDSFNHLLLISEIEKKMGIKFSISDVARIKTFKQLKEFITSKKPK